MTLEQKSWKKYLFKDTVESGLGRTAWIHFSSFFPKYDKCGRIRRGVLGKETKFFGLIKRYFIIDEHTGEKVKFKLEHIAEISVSFAER